MLRPEYVGLARTAAERSLVLLKNAPAADGTTVLPLAANKQNIALIGPLSDDPPNMLGSWAGLGRPQDVTSLHSALAARIGAQHLLRAHGAGILEQKGGRGASLALAEACKTPSGSCVRI